MFAHFITEWFSKHRSRVYNSQVMKLILLSILPEMVLCFFYLVWFDRKDKA